MKKEDFKVGQTVYLASRHGTREATIRKIGRKYITVQKSYTDIKFDMTNNFKEKDKYRPYYELYLTKQQISDEQERKYLYDKIKNTFNWDNKNKYSLEKLRKINEILGQEETEK